MSLFHGLMKHYKSTKFHLPAFPHLGVHGGGGGGHFDPPWPSMLQKSRWPPKALFKRV